MLQIIEKTSSLDLISFGVSGFFKINILHSQNKVNSNNSIMKTPAPISRKVTKVILATLAIGLFNSSLNANYEETDIASYRPVHESDFNGLWEQVGIREGSVHDLSNPWYTAPQLYSFSDDGYMKKLIKRGGELTDQDLDRLNFSPNTTHYQVEQESGAMTVSYEEGIVYNWVGTYCLKDSKTAKADDIIISCLEDNNSETPLFYRLLRKRPGPSSNE